jgi:hypothetical protein
MRYKITFKNGDIDFINASNHEQKPSVHLFFKEHPTRGEFILADVVKSVEPAPKEEVKLATPRMTHSD